MLTRVMQENVTLRERYENRISDVETRIGTLERFRAQTVLLGGIALIILGAVTASVAHKLFGIG